MSVMPLLLAGPIIRRVEPNQVSIWVALSEACEIELTLWEGEVTSTSNDGQPVATAQTVFATGARSDSIRVGEKLHLALASWNGTGSTLKHGTLYSYNIKLKRKSNNAEDDLSSLRLLKDDSSAGKPPVLALGFAEKRLPAFATVPDDLLKVQIAHGSCRKTFGQGEDALAHLDTIIKDNRTAVDKRPQQLFLTGDQIYADEVAEMLLPAINAVGQELIGRKTDGTPRERIALNVQGQTQMLWPADLRHFPSARRQTLVQKAAGFTSTEANSHLLSLGEFCALYLFAWSNVLWPETFTAEADLYADPGSNVPATHQLLTPLNKLAELRAAYADRKKEIERYRKALPKVRRVLASVATYMIFDDHEITDDWYLTEDWRRQVLLTPLGRYVLCNGLTAYGLFQGWGNDPQAFKTGKGQEFLTRVQQLFPADADGPVESVQGPLQTLYGMVADPFAEPAQHIKWFYTVPTPKYDVFVLDPRNWRKGRSLYSPPALIQSTILEQQISSATRAQGKELSIVVSPAPVLGLPTIEEVLQPSYTLILDLQRSAGKGVGAADKDPEAWSFDPFAMEALFARLRGHEKVVFLSGDVHYALTADLNYWQKGTGNALEAKARFVQLTASSLKNIEHKLYTLASSSAAQVVFDRLEAPLDRLVWDAKEPAPVTAPSGSRIPAQYRNRLKETPVLLETPGWPAGTNVARTPDRAWRFRLVRDGRNDSQRPEPVRHLVLQADLDPEGDVGARYAEMLARHQHAVRKSDPRLAFFDTNVGTTGFERAASLKLTEQALTQIEQANTVAAPILERLKGLKDRDILQENFRAVVKAHVGAVHALSTQQLDAIQAQAVRTENSLALRHRLHAVHPDAPNTVGVFMQQLASLELTTEPAPAIQPEPAQA